MERFQQQSKPYAEVGTTYSLLYPEHVATLAMRRSLLGLLVYKVDLGFDLWYCVLII
jgi:hypothetical protein